MTKSELIRELSYIEGDPDIKIAVAGEGICKDIFNIADDALVEQTVNGKGDLRFLEQVDLPEGCEGATTHKEYGVYYQSGYIVIIPEL